MDSYISFAQVYDMFMDNVDYPAWCEYIRGLLNEYEITKNYFDGKKGFEDMMRTINDIIQHFITGDSGCGGSCATCGGCH